MYRVLLVEDDPRLAELVTEYLSGYEFSVDLVTRGDTALEHFKQSQPDVVVLDLMLPGMDGMVVCRQIREQSEVPILILTAREDTYDEVSGLEQGADDFVNKPVQPRVLLARLRALLRRTQTRGAAADTRVLEFGALRIKKMRGIEFDGLDRSIDNCISKLRKKFDDNLSEKIKTVWGEGYLFSPSAWN
jgi:two-component system OmpR family response regulator